MQEECENWHEIGNPGCCLLCPNARPGCLCFDCKCTKCFHYSAGEDKGHCDLRKSKEGWANFYDRQEKIKINQTIALKRYNEELEKEINIHQGNILNLYSCQSCFREFRSRISLTITPSRSPVCPICTGKLRV